MQQRFVVSGRILDRQPAIGWRDGHLFGHEPLAKARELVPGESEDTRPLPGRFCSPRVDGISL